MNTDHLKAGFVLLPRYKILITLVILLGLFFGAWQWFAGVQNTNQYQQTLEAKPVANGPYDDPDGDGLQNWQEDLYQTSRTRRDTDGDGATDPQEITAGTNPTVFGEGLSEDPLDPQEITYRDYEFNPQDPQGFTLNDYNDFLNSQNPLLTNPTQDQELKDHINALGQAVEGTYIYTATDAELFTNLFDSETSVDRAQTDPYIQAYKLAATQIQGYQGETLLEAESLALRYRSLAQSLETLSLYKSGDPIDHQTLVNAYSQAVVELHKGLIAIHNIVISRELSFGPDEPGRFFLFELEQ